MSEHCPHCKSEDWDLALQAIGGSPEAQSHFLRIAQRKLEYDQQVEMLHAHNELLVNKMNYFAHQAAYHRAFLRQGREPTQDEVSFCFDELEQARKQGNDH